jgi:hypothetical protein
VRQDVVDAVSFAVWERVQAGQPLTLALCREVAELGSTVNARLPLCSGTGRHGSFSGDESCSRTNKGKRSVDP